MGGLETDENSAVLGSVSEAIGGLNAAGEVAGGVHGNYRSGGNSLLDCVVFGRVTGVACARYVLGDNTKAASLVKCMEVPELCSAGVGEMRENDEHDQNGSAGKS